MVVEYFLRNGYYNAAITLADKSEIKDLTNIGKHILRVLDINVLISKMLFRDIPYI